MLLCDAEPYAGMQTCWGREDCAITTQLVDQETKAAIPLTEGATGERVKTSLRWEAQPQLRASVGDVYQVHTDTCACGVPGVRIRVLGRTDDLLIVKGVGVLPGGREERRPGAAAARQRRLPGSCSTHRRRESSRRCGSPSSEARASTRPVARSSRPISKDFHQRMTVRPEITVVPAGTFERTALKEKLIERAYETGS